MLHKHATIEKNSILLLVLVIVVVSIGGLVEALQPYGLSERFAHIAVQRGMFSYTGLTPVQVQRLRDEFSVYLVNSGRASVAGMSEARLDYLAGAIARVCQA